MIRVFLKNGVGITHVNSITYRVSPNYVTLLDHLGNETAIYNTDSIAGVAKLPEEYDNCKDQLIREDIEKIMHGIDEKVIQDLDDGFYR